MQLQYRLLPLFDAMIGQPEFPEGFRRGALARGWDLGQSRQPLSREQIETAKHTQSQLAQILSELSQWLPDIEPTSDTRTTGRRAKRRFHRAGRARSHATIAAINHGHGKDRHGPYGKAATTTAVALSRPDSFTAVETKQSATDGPRSAPLPAGPSPQSLDPKCPR